MPINKKGYFISFEGIDGSGKSTQINLLKKFFAKQNNRPVIFTREPGGTNEAELIRNLLINSKHSNSWESKTEILLLFAARYEHFKKVIKPAIDKGKLVICDRFIDSTIAYQCNNNKLLKDFCFSLSKLILGNFKPDLTFLLDIEPKFTLERIDNRDTKNFYDKKSLEFFTNVRNEYIKIANKLSRVIVLDANSDIEFMSSKIINIILKKID